MLTFSEYSSGAACQMGNLAYNMKTLFNIHDLEDASIIPATAGNFMKIYSNITFDTPGEAFVVRLPELTNIKFVEVLLHPEVDANYFKQHFMISLDTKVKEYSSDKLDCNVETNPFALAQTLPNGIKRLSYECNNPSTGSEVKMAANSDVRLPFWLPIVRIVAIGHKYIDIDYLSCEEEAGDQEFKWCSVCNGAYPPDCKRKCESGHWGENCEYICPKHCILGVCDLRNGDCLCQGEPCQSTETSSEFSREQETIMNKDFTTVSAVSSTDNISEADNEQETVTIKDVPSAFATSPQNVISTSDIDNTTNIHPVITMKTWIVIAAVTAAVLLTVLILGLLCYKCHKYKPKSGCLLANPGLYKRYHRFFSISYVFL